MLQPKFQVRLTIVTAKIMAYVCTSSAHYLKQKTEPERRFEVFSWFGEGRGTVEKKFLARPSTRKCVPNACSWELLM